MQYRCTTCHLRTCDSHATCPASPHAEHLCALRPQRSLTSLAMPKPTLVVAALTSCCSRAFSCCAAAASCCACFACALKAANRASRSSCSWRRCSSAARAACARASRCASSAAAWRLAACWASCNLQHRQRKPRSWPQSMQAPRLPCGPHQGSAPCAVLGTLRPAGLLPPAAQAFDCYVALCVPHSRWATNVWAGHV